MNHTKADASQSRRPFLIVSIVVAVLLITLFLLWLRGISAMPVVSIPTQTMPKPNALDYFVKASHAMRDEGKIGSALNPSYSQADREKMVRENATALAIARQGLTFAYANAATPSFVPPSFDSERALASLLALDSQVKAARGDWNEAVNSGLDAVQIGAMLAHSGGVIGMLSGAYYEALGRQPIWNDYQHLNAAQSRVAAQRLEAIAKGQESYAETLEQEKRMKQALLLEVFHTQNMPHDIARLLLPSNLNHAERLREAQMLFTPKRRMMRNFTTYMNKAIAIARQPYATAPPLPPIPSDPFCEMMLPIFSTMRFRPTENATQDASLTTTLALHACHEEQGSYPTSLATLVPKYLKAMPNDPFAASGRLRYRRTNIGYVLYSIGPDGHDDGGTAIFDASKRSPAYPGGFDPRRYASINSKGDIVAGIND